MNERCAPETLKKGTFSVKSDVWSFGVLVWEIFNDGNIPFNYMSNKEVANAVPAGERLGKADCPDEVYKILMKCWKQDPAERPSFEQLLKELEGLIEEQKKKLVITLNALSAQGKCCGLNGRKRND